VRVLGYCHDESGATVIEHAIVVCVMALVIVYAVGSGLSPGEALRRIQILTGAALTSEPPAQTIDRRPVTPGGDSMTIEQKDLP
jgi:Flp pilus assembly pilin Flp